MIPDTGTEEHDDEIRVVEGEFSLTQVLEYIAHRVEAVVDEGGWDVAPTLWTLEMPTDVPPEVAAAASAHDDDEEPHLHGVFALRMLEVLEAAPEEALVGRRAPQDAVAVLLAVEGWALPDDVCGPNDDLALAAMRTRPSEHPRRIETRQVLAVMRDGTLVIVRRDRGAAPYVVPGVCAGPGGRLIGLLRSFLGTNLRVEDGVTPMRAGELSYVRFAVDQAIELLAVRGDDEEHRQEACALVREMLEEIRDARRDGVVPAGLEGFYDCATSWSALRAHLLAGAHDDGEADAVRFLEWCDDRTMAEGMGAYGDVSEELRTLVVALGDDDQTQALCAMVRGLGLDRPIPAR